LSGSEELQAFIASGFRSIWSLELLLLLKREPRKWLRTELVSALRASELVVGQALDSLVTAGLVALEDDAAWFAPASETTARLVDATEQLYARRPDAVRRLIVLSPGTGLAAFADAFRLKRE
jgi:hypothetical protein